MSASNESNSSRRGSWWWWVSILAVGLVLGLGALEILGALLRPLAIFFLGLTLAATLDPIVTWLVRRMPRLLAVILVYGALLLALAAIIGVAIPAAAGQVQQLSERLPDLIEQGQQLLEEIPWLDTSSLQSALTSVVANIGSAAVSVPAAVSSSLLAVGLAVFISFYWLLLTPRIKAFFFSLFAKEQQNRIGDVLAEAAGAMGGYLRGASLDGLIVGAVTYIGLLIIGVDYAAVLGLLSGVLVLLPAVGPVIAAVIIVLVAALQSLPLALFSLIFMIVMQQIESNILVPNIMSTQTSMSPLLTILALFVGGSLGGFLGALVAIPLAAALRVIVVRVVAPAIRSLMGAPHPQDEENDAEENG